MKHTSCTCLIPLYNEQEGVIAVIEKLADIQYFDEIILIDDGSQDNSLSIIQEFIKTHEYTHIRVISYAENKGKTHAIRTGLQEVKTKYIFMFDSDLKWVKKNEIIYTIEHMYNHPEVSMGILRRIGAKWHVKMLYRELILSGQRMLSTEDLKKIFEHKFEKYQLEVAINTFMEKNKKIVVRYPFSAENTEKSKKWWLLDGRKRDMSMYKDILKYQGVLGYIRHSFVFSPINEKKYK